MRQARVRYRLSDLPRRAAIVLDLLGESPVVDSATWNEMREAVDQLEVASYMELRRQGSCLIVELRPQYGSSYADMQLRISQVCQILGISIHAPALEVESF